MINKLLIFPFVFLFFGYGLLVGKDQIFPFDEIVSFKKILFHSERQFQDARSPDNLVTYKKTEQGNLKLHFFYPTNYNMNKTFPTAIFFFGGGWISGTPKQFYPQCEYLSSRGMLCVSAEYRVNSKHKTSPIESVEDAKSAIRYLRKNASKYKINMDKLVAGGGSAGGHLAAATGSLLKYDNTEEDLSISSKPNALILFNPVYDNSVNGYGYKRVQHYWRDISPTHNLSENTPPTIVFLGERDHHLSVDVAKEYQQRMIYNGVKSELHIYKDQEHGFFNFNKKYFNETLVKMDDFLKELDYLK